MYCRRGSGFDIRSSRGSGPEPGAGAGPGTGSAADAVVAAVGEHFLRVVLGFGDNELQVEHVLHGGFLSRIERRSIRMAIRPYGRRRNRGNGRPGNRGLRTRDWGPTPTATRDG